MKQSSTRFLQIVLVLTGIGVLAFLLIEPHFEGVNAGRTVFQIYFTDPFLAYVYLGSIPFFVALYHAIKVLGHIGQDAVSHHSVEAVRTIKYCAFITAGAIIGADIFLAINARLLGGTDDPAGAVMLGMIAIVLCIAAAISAGLFEGMLKRVAAKRA